MKKRPYSIVGVVAVAVTAALVVPVSAAPAVDTSVMRAAVTVPGITEHMQHLEDIANANPFEGIPTRATGTPGHSASVQYVVDTMTAAGFNVTTQDFTADIFF